MDLNQTIAKLDSYFDAMDMEGAGAFLEETITRAKYDGDMRCLLAVSNEAIGYYRDMGNFERCFEYCGEAYAAACSPTYLGTIEYATSLLNIANAYRAGGELDASMSIYYKVNQLYGELLPEEDKRYAALYNNLGLLYIEKKQYLDACECFEAALEITAAHPDAYIEAAVSHSNLANAMMMSGEELTEMMPHAEQAVAIFESMDEKHDYHYPAALSTLAEAKYRTGSYLDAAATFEKAAEIRKAFMKTDENWKKMIRSAEKIYAELGKAKKVSELQALLRAVEGSFH